MSTNPEAEADEPRRWFGFTCWELEMFALLGCTQLADSTELSMKGWILPVLQSEWGITDEQEGLLGSATSVGTGLGALAAGIAADKWGRRPTYLVCLALITVGGACSVAAPNWWTFCACRFVTNVGTAAISLSYSLLAELLSSRCRDRALMLVGLFWGLGGVICDKVAGILVQKTDGSAPRWREYMALMVLPILMLLLWARARLPETPVWKQAQQERLGATPRASEVVVPRGPASKERLGVALLVAADDVDGGYDDGVAVAHQLGGAPQRCDSFRSEGRAVTAASPWAQARLLLCGPLAPVTWSVCLVWGCLFGAFGYDNFFQQLGERVGIAHPAMVTMEMLKAGPGLCFAVLSAASLVRTVGSGRYECICLLAPLALSLVHLLMSMFLPPPPPSPPPPSLCVCLLSLRHSVLLIGTAVQGVSCMALSICLHRYAGGSTLTVGALFLTHEVSTQFAMAALRVMTAAAFPAEQRASGFGLTAVAQTGLGAIVAPLGGLLMHDIVKYGLMLTSLSALAMVAEIVAVLTAKRFAAAAAAEGEGGDEDHKISDLI
jgi:MFS family permease